MKKISLLFFALLFAAFTVQAQDASTFKVSVGAELGFPTGNFSNTHSIGFGGTAQVEFPVQDKLSATATGVFCFTMVNQYQALQEPNTLVSILSR